MSISPEAVTELSNCLLRTRALTLNELADVPIGESKDVHNSCITSVSGGQINNYCPTNNEFALGYGGSCRTSTLRSGAGYLWDESYCPGGWCSWGHCPTGGSVATCKRTGYTADKTQCCIGGQSLIGNQTCDVRYRDPKSVECAQILSDHCKAHSNPFTDSRCKEYMGAITTPAYNSVAAAYCAKGDNLFKPDCLAWVNAAGKSNQAVNTIINSKCIGSNIKKEPCKSYIKSTAKTSPIYDQRIIDYCKSNQNDTECRCLLLKASDKPICADPQCSNLPTGVAASPFKTYDMNTSQCNYTDCRQLINAMGGIDVKGDKAQIVFNLSQQCGNLPGAESSTILTGNNANDLSLGATTTNKGDLSTQTQQLIQQQLTQQLRSQQLKQQEQEQKNKKIMYFIIFVAIVIIIGGGLIYFLTKSDVVDQNDYDNQPYYY